MQPINFRDAAPADLPMIVSIYNSTVASRMVTADTEPVSVESRLAWLHAHTPGKRPLWVVETAEKEMAGWVSFQDFYGRPAYAATAELSIYLHPDHRGRGLGARVLQYCIARCGSLGIRNLMGYIFAHNTPSIRLFQQQGFQEWASLPDIAELDGVERTVKILGRRTGGAGGQAVAE